MRKKLRKRAIYLFIVLCTGAVVYAQQQGVPDEYRANYKFADSWKSMIKALDTIKASKKTGSAVDAKMFSDLLGYFDLVFHYLPQEGQFGSIYEQCRITASNLRTGYSHDKFNVFVNLCHEALIKSMSEMNAKYAIKAKAKANPSSGNAPLTVSFNAIGSSDPSGETIPKGNYYWYYKDVDSVDKVIGVGSAVTHTFTEAGRYEVHLTVRSANQEDKGILDGEVSKTIVVSPQSARIRIYANGEKMKQTGYMKVLTTEAKRGVLFDASATAPTGGHKIEKHRWTITQGTSNQIHTEEGLGNPGELFYKFPTQGQFTLVLGVVDNQGNTMKHKYQIIISDPLAKIKSTPKQGNTSTKFTFDGSTSYSLVSGLKNYTWEIFDDKDGKIRTFQGKSIDQKFAKPGSYTVKLTVEDQQGRRNRDTIQVYVESTKPQAQFSMKSTNEREYNSKFLFDAGLSSDIDVINADDELRYSRRFTPEKYVQVQESKEEGRQVVVAFNQPGKYQAKLTVQDSYGKISEVIKDVEIESSLRPIITIGPKATKWGTPVTMVARNDTPDTKIVSYEWDFGDGKKETTSSGATVQHMYDKVGVYNVSLTTHASDNQKNTVTDMVFIGEKNSPTVAFKVVDRYSSMLKQTTECSGKPAYEVDRREAITIDASDSINTKGESSGITTYIQPQGDDIYEKATLSHKFQEIGCQYVDIKVQDGENRKISSTRTWFNITNALPLMQNIELSFPQYGGGDKYDFNMMSFGESLNGSVKDQQDAFAPVPTVFKKLIVDVSAKGMYDPDGIVSYHKRYYYKKDNPGRILDAKITPSTVSKVSFALDRLAGEYEFGMTIVDNDGGESRSVDLLGGGRTVYFPPDAKNTNIPIVTLKQSQTIVKAGDEVTFTVNAKLNFGKDDFATNRVIKYDFDGNGETDLTTKNDKVKHTYRKAGEFTPKVTVVYKGNSGFDTGERIVVQQNVKALMYITQHGTRILAKDVSIGSVIESIVCLDARKCSMEKELIKDLGKNADKDHKAITHDYGTGGTYFIDIKVKDDLGQEARRKYGAKISTMESVPFFHLLSIPEAKKQKNDYTISVGRQLDNAVSYFLEYRGSGICYMDLDPEKDTNNDSIKDNDEDVLCNTLHTRAYDNKRSSRLAKIHYTQSGSKVSHDVIINFIDAKNMLEPKEQLIYEKLGNIVASLSKDSEEDKYLRSLLIQLQSSLDNTLVRSGLIMDIEAVLKENKATIGDAEKEQLILILASMKDADLAAAGGGTAYDQAKADIIEMANPDMLVGLTQAFTRIETAEKNAPEIIKNELQSVIDIFKKAQQEKKIDNNDVKQILMPNICRIMTYHEIKSDVCQDIAKDKGENTGVGSKGGESGNEEGSTLMGSIIKRTLIIVGILVVIFGGLVGFFVVKAKRAQAGKAE